MLTIYDSSWWWIPTALKYATYLLYMIHQSWDKQLWRLYINHHKIPIITLYHIVVLYHGSLRRCTYIILWSSRCEILFQTSIDKRNGDEISHTYVWAVLNAKYYNTALLQRIRLLRLNNRFQRSCYSFNTTLLEHGEQYCFQTLMPTTRNRFFPTRNFHRMVADERTTRDLLSWR